MQKTKVVLIHNIVSPHVTRLFQELSKYVDLTVFYCSRVEGNRKWQEKPKGFKYKILKNLEIRIKGRDLFTYFINPTIFSDLKRSKPEVVIISGWDLFSYQAAYFYCKINNTKLILISGSTINEKSWRRTVSLPLVKLIIRGCDALIAYGARAKSYLKMLGAKSKIYIYNHSTDVSTPAKVYPKKFRDRNIVLFYGQLINRKGVDILIEAIQVVAKDNSKIKLNIVGSGQEKPHLVEQTSGLGNIKFYDDPGDAKVGHFFESASLFVLPSREEVWGLSINLAMAAGLPVVVSNKAGAAEDLVKEGYNGYIFKSGSSKDLAKKINLVLASRADMGRASLDLIKDYTPKNSANIIYEAVKSVCNS